MVMFGNLGRIFRHLCFPPWRLRHALPPESLKAIARAIRDSERKHGGEIRFAVEAALDWRRLLGRVSARERGIEVFSDLRVWDTERNNGVLIYLLLADHDVEIVADRGIDRRVGGVGGERICRDMESAFRRGEFEAGILAGIEAVGEHLARHFGGADARGNELPDQPSIIKG
jgi:uncharacterized membrane protein